MSKHDKMSPAREILGSRRKLIDVVFLNGQAVKLPSKYCVYIHRFVLFQISDREDGYSG